MAKNKTIPSKRSITIMDCYALKKVSRATGKEVGGVRSSRVVLPQQSDAPTAEWCSHFREVLPPACIIFFSSKCAPFRQKWHIHR